MKVLLVEDSKFLRLSTERALTKAGLLEWHFIALDAPLQLEFLFDASIDVAKPYDRTTRS